MVKLFKIHPATQFLNAGMAVAVLLLSALIFTACETSMGLGSPVDLEPPELRVISIELPNGDEIFLQTDAGGKLFIGKGIEVGPDSFAFLKGEARDNVEVVEVVVEEIDTQNNNQVINTWRTKPGEIGAKDKAGWQSWKIALDGIQHGERQIVVTAYDMPGLIGQDTVKEVTLLIDTNPPIVERVYVQRQAGVQVELMPRTALTGLKPNLFEHIDYFQNENFIIRAFITHDFPLAAVWVNLIDETGKAVFDEPGLSPGNSSLYTPSWDLTAGYFTDYAADARHIFNVVITARAAAGHDGTNIAEGELVTNYTYSLCWYPDADLPHIEITLIPNSFENNEPIYYQERGSLIPINIFDDDNVDDVYAAIVRVEDWDSFDPGSSDNEKLASLHSQAGREAFTLHAENTTPLSVNRRQGQAPVRNTTLAVEVGYNRGRYKLIMLAMDRGNERAARVSHAIWAIEVLEEGAPIIAIEAPNENESAKLNDDHAAFTMKGAITNLEPVSFLRIAWVPAGYPLEGRTQTAVAEAALRNTIVPRGGKAEANGIIIWDVVLTPADPVTIANNVYAVRNFERSFNIFEDFMYNGNLENEPKFFMLYTEADTFQSFRLLAYKALPEITVLEPNELMDYANGDEINFYLNIASPMGVPLREDETHPLELFNQRAGEFIPLEWVGEYDHTVIERVQDAQGNITTETTTTTWPNVYKYTIPGAQTGGYDKGTHVFSIEVFDTLDNREYKEITVTIADKPELISLYTEHSAGASFSSRDSVTIKAVFDRAVNAENIIGVPRLLLDNITNDTDTPPAYASYADGAGSTILEFVYNVRENDLSGGLKVEAFDFSNGSDIYNVIFPSELDNGRIGLDAATTGGITDKALQIDGVRPTISAIVMTGNNVDEKEAQVTNPDYWPWHKTGNELTITVEVSKPVKILGNPKLRILIKNTGDNLAYREANFDHLGNNDKEIIFKYKVKEGDYTGVDGITGDEEVKVDRANCFSINDLEEITDKVGTESNVLKQGNGTVNADDEIRIDAVAPALLGVKNDDSFTVKSSRRFIVETAGRADFPNHTYGGASQDPDFPNPTIVTGDLEDLAGVEYTIDGVRYYAVEKNRYLTAEGWNPTGTAGEPEWSWTMNGSGSVTARQIDRAGNVGRTFPAHRVDMTNKANLVGITCGTPDGVYGESGRLAFNLIFSGSVNYSGGASITIEAGAGSDNPGWKKVLTFDTNNISGNVLSQVWDLSKEPDIHLKPVMVTGVVLNGVLGDDNDTPNDNAPNAGGDYLSRGGLEVNTIRPKVTHIGAVEAGGAVTEYLVDSGMSNVVVPPGVFVAGRSVIRLKFNHEVWPENGNITIRPANGWHIPPVLGNDDYGSVERSLSGADQASLSNNYKATTHGLITSGGRYVPHTVTKYVLNYGVDINGAAGAVNNVRTALNRAKFYWQEVESGNDIQVVPVDSSGNKLSEAVYEADGSLYYQLRLDTLADGRQWRIDIDTGAFFNAAGNTNAEWNSQDGNTGSASLASQGAIANGGYFWSAKTAVPVIRVDRVSNNSASDTAALRTRTRFRIDCETPGANISYNTWNRGTPANLDRSAANPETAAALTPQVIANRRGVGAGVATIMPDMGINGTYTQTGTSASVRDILIYRAYPESADAMQNSNILDATTGEIDAMMTAAGIGTGVAPYTAEQMIGGGSGVSYAAGSYYNAADLYTARKDYIAAIASAPPLAMSGRAYEGAFKTVLVYRNPSVVGVDDAGANDPGGPDDGKFLNNDRMKVEGTNTQNGAVTIDGFPLNINIMDGSASRFLYRNNVSGRDDHIWISWEIVSDYWQVFVGVRANGDLWVNGYNNAWNYWPELWWRWMYRKYGNWGLIATRYPAYGHGGQWYDNGPNPRYIFDSSPAPAN